MKPGTKNSYNSLTDIKIEGMNYKIFSLSKAEVNGLDGISKLPKSLKVLLENLLRYEDDLSVNKNQIDAIKNWCNELEGKLRYAENGTHSYIVAIMEDDERHIFLPSVSVTAHGVSQAYTFSRDFFSSHEYEAMVALGHRLRGLLEDGAFIKRGDRKKQILNFEDALRWLMAESRRGINTQRYKGLGEMNPGQLWETTLDPENRRMLRVTIDDAATADQMFTTLMGDNVEPRRQFIDSNALSVVNLDI